jgi:hypothetical protein
MSSTSLLPPAAAQDGKLLCRIFVPKRNLTKTIRLNLVRAPAPLPSLVPWCCM